MSSTKNAFVFVLGLALLFAAYGCSGPLRVSYKPAVGGDLSKLKDPVRISIAPVADARGAADPRRIGKIEATIADMNATELVLSEEPARLVEEALAMELKRAGFEVVNDEADFSLRGAITAFRLDVGGRDEVEITIGVILADSMGEAVWSGPFNFKQDRYAGVMGNSRATLERLVNGALSSAIRKGVNDMAAAVDGQAVNAQRPALIVEAAPTGRLVISSAPPRAKVYIDEVYYGLTPLTLDIRPGIHDVSVGQKGFRDSKERVSVRSGETTELPAVLDKE